MRRGRMAGILAIVVAFACASGASARTLSPCRVSVHDGQASCRPHHGYVRSLGPRAGRAHAFSKGHGKRFVALVGDPGSGLGFYPLPVQYRIGAWRYHLRNQRPPWQNPVLFAIAADALRYNDWVVANQGYRYGVFNPIEGVGTPFFAGFYGPAGDEDECPFPFGCPYAN
jgi:hypothetical protein